MTMPRWPLALTLCGLCLAPPAIAQTCDDFNPCTTDMCAAGRCIGTPVAGACDNANECVVDKRCEDGRCVGTAVMDGTSCNDGCGSCTGGVCTANAAMAGQPCNDQFGICTTNDRCEFGVCIGDFIHCPDVDGDKCTTEVCAPAEQRCITLPPDPRGLCLGCGTCDPATGVCAPLNDGMACDDGDVCTGDGHCGGGTCLAGTANTPGPTPTATPVSTHECTGDCDGNGEVSISDIVRGVGIALGLTPLDACTSFDADGDGAVSISDLVRGVNDALGGCV